MADDFARFQSALRWWTGRVDEWPTSSLTGGGAIAALESLLGRLFDGQALALPSGSSAIRAGLRVLGVEPGASVGLVGRTWFGAAGIVESLGGRVPTADEPTDVVVADWSALTCERNPACAAMLIDAANLPPEDYRRFTTRRWDALALSFGPGKPIDAGEGGALVVRRPELLAQAVQLTQHPIRQHLLGLTDIDVATPCERIHPVAALTALHGLSLLTHLDHDVHA